MTNSQVPSTSQNVAARRKLTYPATRQPIDGSPSVQQVDIFACVCVCVCVCVCETNSLSYLRIFGTDNRWKKKF